MNMEIIGSVWFGKIGIVLCADVITNERKAYIGIGEGRSQTGDALWISNHGMPFPVKEAQDVIRARP